jgi:uncharacterized protein YecT (DUF1311 family)
MKRRILLLCAVACSVFAVSAQKKAEDPCKGSTQHELNMCAAEEFKRADAELNQAYQRLLKAAEGDKLAITKIKWAEKTWIVYRDAYVEAMFPAEDKRKYGSMYPMQVNSVKASLTRTQTAALKELLRSYGADPAAAK